MATRETTPLLAALLVLLGGCIGGVGTAPTPSPTDSDPSTGSMSGPVAISLEWRKGPPSAVGETATIAIEVVAHRPVSGETLNVTPPEGVEVVSGERVHPLVLDEGETYAANVTIEATENGTFQVLVVTSNFSDRESETIRSSAFIAFSVGETGGDDEERATAY